uniref:Ig-like domain-containing protein n=1 Tax=Steinernema glaseri TaxID=37863 RepID=A0A1I7ZGX7_9BILA
MQRDVSETSEFLTSREGRHILQGGNILPTGEWASEGLYWLTLESKDQRRSRGDLTDYTVTCPVAQRPLDARPTRNAANSSAHLSPPGA